MPPIGIILVLVSTAIHATWNLLAHARRDDATLFLRAHLVAVLIGVLPLIWLEQSAPALPSPIWFLLAMTGLFQGLYFFGLSMGYRSGEFSLVYPLARALPVLALAVLDLGRGRPPSLLGWAGMILVVAGCAVLPLNSLHAVSRTSYLNRTVFWVLVTALGTVGYSSIDKVALESLPSGWTSALRYAIYQWIFTVPFLYLTVRWGVRLPVIWGEKRLWKDATLAALCISSAYTLVLWAYQFVPQASYVVALRQFSIVIGVVAVSLFFAEPVSRYRLGAAVVITGGVILVGSA